MSNYEFIIALVGAVLGSAGLTTFLTCIANKNKVKEESKKTAEESMTIKQTRELQLDQYINDKLKELTESYRAETNVLKESNLKLQKQVTDLQNKLQALMSWIVNENHTTQAILISKIRELDPDFEIPETKPFPNPYESNDSNDNN